jgi:uncharacterized membrane protein HdeD (DUF308 family)
MARRWSEQLVGPEIPGTGRFESWIVGGRLTRSDLRRVRKWLLVAGVLALISGVVAVCVPIIAAVTISILVGWVLLAAGIAVGIHAVSHRSLFRGLEALVTVIAGFYVLVFPLSGTVTLTFVLAVWFFASGVISLTYAAQWRGAPGAWFTAFGGALSVILGFLIAASLPSSASWAIGLLVGINLVLWGVRALIGARLLKDLLES